MDVDELFYDILMVINPHWVERMSQDTGEADLEEGSIVENIQDKSEGNNKLKDDVDILRREAQSLRENMKMVLERLGIPQDDHVV